jgi:hypothetical protein
MKKQKGVYILIVMALLMVFLVITAMNGLMAPVLPKAYAQGSINPSSLVAENNTLIQSVRGFQDQTLKYEQASTPKAPGRIRNPVELRVDNQMANQQDGILSSPPLGPQASVDLVLDDGTFSSSWGYTSLSGKAVQFIWLNRFTPDPASFPLNLNDIWVLFGNSGGTANVKVGDAIDLVVYQDSDGDPTNGATWLDTYNVTIQTVDGSTWSEYHLASPLLISGPGDVIIGVINRYVESGVTDPTYPANIDYTTNQERSWSGYWSDDPPDPAELPPDGIFTQRLGNWMIRGYGETTGEPPSSTSTTTTTSTTTGTTTSTATRTQTPTETQEPIEQAVNLPIVLNEFPPRPTATPTPPLSQVYVQNDTGGQLCYEVLNTGIGEKCFSSGKSFYGSFPAGTYSWKASARCGSASGTRTYSAGEYIHRFWCSVTSIQDGQP